MIVGAICRAGRWLRLYLRQIGLCTGQKWHNDQDQADKNKYAFHVYSLAAREISLCYNLSSGYSLQKCALPSSGQLAVRRAYFRALLRALVVVSSTPEAWSYSAFEIWSSLLP